MMEDPLMEDALKIGMDRIRLNDGTTLPALGLGVFRVPADGTTCRVVKKALSLGYRLIDTARAYGNEEEVGSAIRESGIPRDEIFVTSKLWFTDYGRAREALEKSLERLGLDHLDLCLLHQPYGEVLEAWQVLEEAKKAGKVRSIGVSNFTPRFWERHVPALAEKPSVNQVECHPLFQQRILREQLLKSGTLLQAWAPLACMNDRLMSRPHLAKIAKAHGKSPAQVVLRFLLTEGIGVVVGSTSPDHMRENLDLGFALTDEETEVVRGLDTGKGFRNPDEPGREEYLRKTYG